MKLSEWAKQQGVCYRTAHRMFRKGTLPVPFLQLPTGTIVVYPEQTVPRKAVLYGRVSSHDQRGDLSRQMSRLRDFAAANGLVVAAEVSEVGSGLNGRRPGLLKVLEDPKITAVVVEHRDRLSRFGFEYIEAGLRAAGRSVVVINDTEEGMDLVQDMVDVMTSLCARLYGKRSARNRAKRAVEAAGSNEN